MKKSIYESKYVDMLHSKALSYLELIWTQETSEMTKEEFIDEMHIYVKLVTGFSVKYVLNDNRKTDFVLTPDIQEWIAKEVYPKTVKSLLKIALVMQEDFIQQLATEQMVDEWEYIHGKNKLKSKYFKGIEPAKKWLNISEGVRSQN